MSYKTRLRNIERNIQRKINKNEKYYFDNLFKPDFTYTGKPFNTFPEAFKYFKIEDVPGYLTNEQMQIMYEKGLVSVSINEVLQEMKENL